MDGNIRTLRDYTYVPMYVLVYNIIRIYVSTYFEGTGTHPQVVVDCSLDTHNSPSAAGTRNYAPCTHVLDTAWSIPGRSVTYSERTAL